MPSPPVLRIDGVLEMLEDYNPLKPQDIESVFEQITNQEQRVDFFREKELDFAYSVAGLARFRVNILQQRGSMGIAFRMIPFHIPTVDELNRKLSLEVMGADGYITKPFSLAQLKETVAKFLPN